MRALSGDRANRVPCKLCAGLRPSTVVRDIPHHLPMPARDKFLILIDSFTPAQPLGAPPQSPKVRARVQQGVYHRWMLPGMQFGAEFACLRTDMLWAHNHTPHPHLTTHQVLFRSGEGRGTPTPLGGAPFGEWTSSRGAL
eukprot:1155628-Pelagomonas_calceolata.AAC.2